MVKRLAIIGASESQKPLCITAHNMGYETICFAWAEGAVCRDYVDVFYDISVTDKEKILFKCKELCVSGIVTNCSDFLAEIVVWLNEQMGFHTTSYAVYQSLKNKQVVRELSEMVPELSKVDWWALQHIKDVRYPCVVKPVEGGSKRGVSYVQNEELLLNAVRYAKDERVIIEQYIQGKELSVEVLSYEGQHYIIQITDKDCFGAPHFIEIGHHQPANIPLLIKEKIHIIVPKLLRVIGFTDGATHIELKYRGNELYLVEINLRGGGDEISNKLVSLSTNYNYLEGIIQIATGQFLPPNVANVHCAGIYYLCAQTEKYLQFFESASQKPWCVDMQIKSKVLSESKTNDDRNGYLIYQSEEKVLIH